jgi:hypothetical protein
MGQDHFRNHFLTYLDQLKTQLSTADGNWTIKGFIDVYKKIYTVTLDTKVLSKILELLMYPVIACFAEEQNFQIIPTSAQNHYPDLSLVSLQDKNICFAIDIKSTYRLLDSSGRVNGMTLGTFGGYFRNRERTLGTTFPYKRYIKHYVLGVIYSGVPNVDETQIYAIKDLYDIPSVIADFQIFFHEKYRIASDIPGSGNTKNIGSTKIEEKLIGGQGVFASLGIDVFDDYWLNYYTRDMARAAGFDKPPYTNLKTYKLFKGQGIKILDIPDDSVETDQEEVTSQESNERKGSENA